VADTGAEPEMNPLASARASAINVSGSCSDRTSPPSSAVSAEISWAV
jgi:hypothetical protein